MNARVRIAAVVLILAILFVGVAGLFSVSYAAGVTLLAGAVVALLPNLRVQCRSRLDRKWLIAGFALLLAAAALALVVFLQTPGRPPNPAACIPGQDETRTTLLEYHAILTPIDMAKGLFQLSEAVTYQVERNMCNADKSRSTAVEKSPTSETLTSRQVSSAGRGLLIREISLTPLAGSQFGGLDCCRQAATIELRNFPRDSFYEAREAQKVEILPYLDKETVKWENGDFERGIAFAYLAPPFYAIRGPLTPLIGLSYQGQWVFGVIGLFLSAVFTPIVKTLLLDSGKGQVKAILEKSPPEKEPEKATLIVSGRGDEKQIQVKHK